MFELVISFYQDKNKQRHSELLSCLEENLKNKYIKRIHLLLEGENVQLPQDKKIVCNLIANRPTYNDFFKYCNRNIKGNAIIANTDILFDNTLSKLYSELQEDHFICLTRYEDNNRPIQTLDIPPGYKNPDRDNIFSQDAWIFKSPMFQEVDIDIPVGTFFCDGLLIYFLHNHSNYKLYNLYHDIKIYHKHKTTIPDSTQKAYDVKYQIKYKKELKEKFNFIDHRFIAGLRGCSWNEYVSGKKTNDVWLDFVEYFYINRFLHDKQFVSIKNNTVA